MKLPMAFVATMCAAAKVVSHSSEGVAICSSLNGPFCQGMGSEFMVAPPHTRQNLDVDDEEIGLAKNVRIEKILKQYEMEKTENVDDKDFLRKFKVLLEESIAQLDWEKEDDDKSVTTSAVESSSTNAALELLRLMNGDELKEFFEIALDEVLVAGEAALRELSPHTLEGLHITIHQFKALRNYSTYHFQQLDELELISIRFKFATDRLEELQQAFENLVIADNAKDRQVAFETAVYLFQLAQEDTM